MDDTRHAGVTTEQASVAAEQARAAADLLTTDGARAQRVAAEIVAELPEADMTAAAAIAHRVLALSELRRGRFDAAGTHIDRAVAAGRACGDELALGEALMTSMGVLIATGEAGRAIEVSHEAEPLLPAELRRHLMIQRGTALGTGLGRAAEAVAEYDLVEQSGNLEPFVWATLLMNRGTQLAAMGETGRALDDLAHSRRHYAQIGDVASECDVIVHESMVAAQIGDFPRVFRQHAEIRRRNLFADSDPRTLNDLSSCMLAAGLVPEAGALAERALTLARGRDSPLDITRAGLRLAEVRFRLGDRREAKRLAAEVSSRAGDHGHGTVQAAADYFGVLASDDTQQATDRLIAIAESLEIHGATDLAADSRIEAALRAVADGATDRVRDIVEPIAGPRGPAFAKAAAPARARARHAEALRYIADDRSASARRQLALALDELDHMRASIGASDLRASASDRSPDLAALGLRLACEIGSARTVLSWVERAKAASLRMVNADARAGARSSLDQLRYSQIGGEAEQNRVRLEGEVALIDRRRVQTPEPKPLPKAGEIAAGVGDRLLIEFFEVANRIHALAIERRRVTLHTDLAEPNEIAGLVDRVSFGLRRMASSRPEMAAAAAAMTTAAAEQIDTTLFGWLRNRRRQPGPIIVVPTGRLHSLPWTVLPYLADRVVSVAPSAHAWLKAQANGSGDDSVSAISGPQLEASARELNEITKLRTSVSAIELASVDQTLAALTGCGTAHIAAHGTFRNDNASLSSIQLADGRLYVYDLEWLERLPSLIVLSACNVGAVDVVRGGEVLGFPAAVLARGGGALIASLLPVEDEASTDLMIELHHSLENGNSPAQALRAASNSVRGLSHRHAAAAVSFVCFGAG